MRITQPPPSLVSTPSSATSSASGPQATRTTSFTARLAGLGAGAAPVGGGGGLSGQSVLGSALASQQAAPGGAVAGAYGLDAALAKTAQTPEQLAALKEIVSQSLQSTASSIFGMAGKGLKLESE